MQNLLRTTAVLLAVANLTLPAHAATIRRKANRQATRIDRGVANGSITKREAGNLDREQARINQERADARADGHMSRSERREIRHDQRVASRHIYNQKHDYQRRPRYRRYHRHVVHHPRVWRHRHWRHHHRY